MGRPRSWTDQDLIEAVEQSATLTEVLRHLGLSVGGAPLTAVRRRMLELGLDDGHLLRHARSPKWSANPDDALAHAPVRGRWTEDELRMAVAGSTCMRQVMQRLGYGRGGAAWTRAKAEIAAMQLDTSHFTASRRRRLVPVAADRALPARRRSWTDAQLRDAVRHSTSVAGVIRALHLKVGGSVYLTLNARIAALGLDTSHFTGKGWSRGKSVTCWKGRPLADILVENSDYLSTGALRRRLVKEGLKTEQCEGCGRTAWEGRRIPLQLDHINGDRRDNRLENLRILCPNCHAQTDTWCGKNQGRYAQGSVMEQADMHRSKWCAFGREGSNPSGPTEQLTLGDIAPLE